MSYFYDSAGQDQITVLMFDSQSPQALFKEDGSDGKMQPNKREDAAWPIPYTYHAEVLNWIIQRDIRPLAVFVDLFYLRKDTAEGIDALVKTAEKFERLNVPLFFADLPQSYDCRGVVRPELKKVVRLARANGITQADDEGEVYALTSPDDCKLDNAAVSLYKEYCFKHSKDCRWLADQRQLYLQWGRYGSPDMAYVRSPTHHASILNPHPVRDFFLFLVRSLGRGIAGDPVKLTTPYHASVNISQLVELRQADGPDAGKWKNQYKIIMKKLFDKKIVLVGADLIGEPDRVRSPIHGNIPGVFLHAMALDNLLVYGEGYWKLPRNRCGNLNIMTLVDIFFLVIALISYSSFKRIKASSSSAVKWHRFVFNSAQFGLFYLFMFGIAILISAVVTFFLKIAPFNFIGMMALICGFGLENFLPPLDANSD